MARMSKCRICDGTGLVCEYDNQIGKWNIQTLKHKIKKVTNPVKREKLIEKYKKLKKKGRILCKRCNGKGFTLQHERLVDL